MRRFLDHLAALRPAPSGRVFDPTDEPRNRRLRAHLTGVLALVGVVAGAPVPFSGLAGAPARPITVLVLLALAGVAVAALWRAARLTDRQFLASQLVLAAGVTLMLLAGVPQGTPRSAELVLVAPLVLAALFARSRGHATAVVLASVVGADVVSVARLADPADAVSQAAGQTIVLLALAVVLRVVRDSAERAFAAVRLAEVTDQLTGVLNRLGFERFGASAWTQAGGSGRRLAVLVLALDHFKTVNDLWGHAGGDDMLARLGSVLRETTRDGDLIVRLGGAEFAVLCPVEPGEGSRVADRIRLHLAQAISPGTVSIGVVEVGPSPSDRPVDDLWRAVLVASSCLNEAKRTGRNRVVVQEV